MQTIDLRKVSLGLLVFALFLSALFTRLGIWQLDRAEQKRETLAEFEKRADASELDLNRMFAMDGGSMWGRHASVTGHYVRPIILLDNQIREGHAGYFVYTAFTISGRELTLLVNRGWIPVEGDRSRIPEFTNPTGEQRLKGRLSHPPQQGLRLTDSNLIERLSDSVWRTRGIDFNALSATGIGGELIPITLLLEASAAGGFDRVWKPPSSDEARHLGYAFQWFALAVTVVVVSVIILLRRTKAESL